MMNVIEERTIEAAAEYGIAAEDVKFEYMARWGNVPVCVCKIYGEVENVVGLFKSLTDFSTMIPMDDHIVFKKKMY